MSRIEGGADDNLRKYGNGEMQKKINERTVVYRKNGEKERGRGNETTGERRW